MQGKIRTYPVLQKADANGIGSFVDTFRNLPPRVAATNLRNYCLGHKVNLLVKFVNGDSDNAASLTARSILHTLGTLGYKDAWGAVYDAEPLDRVYADNLEDRMRGVYKIPASMQVDIPKGATVLRELEVVIAYAPKYFGPVPNRHSFTDGMFPCSLLGEDAEIRLSAMGGKNEDDDQDVTITVVGLRVDSVCFQTRETVPPIPTEYRGDSMASTTNPFVQTGDARKLDFCFYLSEAIGTVQTPVVLDVFTDLSSEILVDLDGHVQYQGPAHDLVLDNENAGIGAPFSYMGVMNGCFPKVYQSLYAGEMAEIFGPMQTEQATQGQAGKRFELRGIGPMESPNTVIIRERRRYECPKALFERWADREGLSAVERSAIRIGGAPSVAKKLRRSEQIGVTQQVGSRKDRAE